MTPDASLLTPPLADAASAPSLRDDGAGGDARWHLRLLGAAAAVEGDHRITRFPSRAVLALLARLALEPARDHPREELIELLWPGVDLAVGRNRLRQALSTLKSLLEPPGSSGAAVVLADRHSLRLVPGALACDAHRFEQLARQASTDPAAAARALSLYQGELLPGYFDDWVVDERHRLAALQERLLATAQATPQAAPQEALAPAAAPAAPAAAGVSTLPTYLTRLFGAERALARLRSRVGHHRLVTLLGPGGNGKTRLAIELASALRDRAGWPADLGAAGEPWAEGPRFDRVVFVPLVACADQAQFCAALARALQRAAGSDEDPVHLLDALAGQRLLLVLDNFEQLVGHAEALVAAWLARLPLLHVLVTSRRSLALDGETLLGADPLALPPAQAPMAEAAANPAVALFVDRARAVRADFHLGARNHAAIVSLVRALGGMPLAIELAASRVRSLAPAEMLSMLAAPAAQGAHLSLLARGSGRSPRSGVDARHASMAEVVAWSWRLLGEAEQQVLAVLTLFASDASLQAVAGVLGWAPAEAAARLDEAVLHSLVRVSGAGPGAARDSAGPAAPAPELPDADPADRPARYGLVEPVREYVLTQTDPGQIARWQQALRAWLLRWARALGPAPPAARVAPELPTVHTVLAQAVADGAALQAWQLALALRPQWDSDALPAALQTALERALAALADDDAAPPGDDAGMRADALELLAYLRFEAGFKDRALAHAEAGLQAAGADPARRSRALTRRAWVDLAAGRSAAPTPDTPARLQGWLDEALALARRCGDREALARALHQEAVLLSHLQGDWAGAEQRLAEAQALWQALGDHRKVQARLRNRAQCWVHLGRRDEALATFEVCERAAAVDGDIVGRIDSQISQASLLVERRQWPAALAVGHRNVALCWQHWHRHGLGYALWNLPLALAHLRQPQAAMRLMAFAATYWQTSYGPLGPADLRDLRRVRALVRVQVGATAAQALWHEGSTLLLAQAVALALAVQP